MSSLSRPLYQKDGKAVVAFQGEEGYGLKLESIDSEGGSEIKLQLSSVVAKHLQGVEVVVIDSVNSGTGRNGDNDIYKELLTPIFKDLDVAHRLIKTESSNSISQTASQWKSENSVVIFISGDTLIGEFINGLNETIKKNAKITLFHIPAGTGNSLSLSLGIFNVVDSIHRLLNSVEVTNFNLYLAKFPTGSYLTRQEQKAYPVDNLKFAVVLSWGFHASLVADSDTPELRKYGIKRFAIAAESNLADEQKYLGDVIYEDEILKGPFAYLVFTPAKRFETTFEILPRGDIKDDQLWLIAFNTEEDNKHYVMDIMKEVYDLGSHIKDERVTYKSFGKGIQIKLNVSSDNLKKRRRFCVDGSIVEIPSGNHEIIIESVGNKHLGWEFFLIN